MTGENNRKQQKTREGKSYGAALFSAGKQAYFEAYFGRV